MIPALVLLVPLAFAADSVIVMQISGTVRIEREPPRVGVLFERLAEGTTVALDDASVVEILYPSNGRLERWEGPAKVEIGAGKSHSNVVGSVATWTPPAIGSRAEALHSMLPGDTRGGHALVRGDGVSPPEDVGLLVATAKEQHAAWTERLGPDDVVPELLLAAACLSVGADHEAVAALSEARRRCPSCRGLRALVDLLSETEARSSETGEK